MRPRQRCKRSCWAPEERVYLLTCVTTIPSTTWSRTASAPSSSRGEASAPSRSAQASRRSCRSACKSAAPAPGLVPAPTAAASAAGMAPTAGAVATTESEVSIATPDGACDAYFVHPPTGTAPAVLVWPDIFGLRPAFRQMGKRLAESGYAVLVVNPFYRTKKAPTSSPRTRTSKTRRRVEALMGLAHTLTPDTEVTDAKALTAWLADQHSRPSRTRRFARWERPATAWAVRSSCARRRRIRIASEPRRDVPRRRPGHFGRSRTARTF